MESLANISAMTISEENARTKECAFIKYKVPAEIRIQIWKLCLAADIRSLAQFYGYTTPNIIKAFQTKSTPVQYRELIATYWSITPFKYFQFNFTICHQTVKLLQNKPLLKNIQNLTCDFQQVSRRIQL